MIKDSQHRYIPKTKTYDIKINVHSYMNYFYYIMGRPDYRKLQSE